MPNTESFSFLVVGNAKPQILQPVSAVFIVIPQTGNQFLSKAVLAPLFPWSYTGTIFMGGSRIHTKYLSPSHPDEHPLKDPKVSKWPKTPHLESVHFSPSGPLRIKCSFRMLILAVQKAVETLQGRKSREQSAGTNLPITCSSSIFI